MDAAAASCITPHPTRPYGDVDCNQTVNVFDVLRVLEGISGVFEFGCTFEDCDIEPCEGNGVVNVLDALAVNNAIGGVNPCCGACCIGLDCHDDYTPEDCVSQGGVFQGGGTTCETVQCSAGAQAPGGGEQMTGEMTSGGTVDISLTSRESALSAELAYEVEVFASSFADMRAYEVGVDVLGGEAGTLEVQDVYIDLERKDHVFAGMESYHAVDVVGRRMVCLMAAGGVASEGPVYLGTFVLRATPDARGTFDVGLRTGDGTILLDSAGRRLDILNAPEAPISVP